MLFSRLLCTAMNSNPATGDRGRPNATGDRGRPNATGDRGRPNATGDRGRIVVLFGAAVLYFVALYAYVPSLPAYVAKRTSSLAAVGMVLSMYGLWMAVLRMPLGIVTDATGRNKPYLIGGVLLAGSAPWSWRSGNPGTLAFGRALTGAAAAAWVPMMVVFAGFFPPEQTIFATSLLSFASSLGQMIGTSITGFLETLGGHALTFFAAAGLSIAATIIIAFVQHPPRGRRSSRPGHAQVGHRDLPQARRPGSLLHECPLPVRRLGPDLRLHAPARPADGGERRRHEPPHDPEHRGEHGGESPRHVHRQRGRPAVDPLRKLRRIRGGCAPGLFRPDGISPLRLHGGHGSCERHVLPHPAGLSIQGVDAAHRSTAMGIHQAVYAIGMFTGPWIGGVIADALGIRAMFAIVAVFSLVAPSAFIALNRPAVPVTTHSDPRTDR